MPYDPLTKPATWVDAQAHRRDLAVWQLFGVVGVLVFAVLYVGLVLRNLWLELPLVGCVLVLERLSRPLMDEADRWNRGARSERTVGDLLQELRGNGFVVMHDLEIGGGNIDHLVSGPTGVFMIETKHRRYEDDDLRKAKRRAALVHDQLGVWVTPVVCLEQRTSKSPYRHDGVWITTGATLTGWLQARRNAVLPFETLARFADRL